MLRARYRLRTFFILVTIVCVAIGTVGTRFYRDYRVRQAIVAVRNASGRVFENDGGEVDRVHFQGQEFTDEKLIELVRHLAYFPQLTEIDLIKCPITDDGLLKLSQLHQLRELYLLETRVSDAGTDILQGNLPQLVVRHESPDPVATGLAATNVFRHAINTIAMASKDQRHVTGNGHGVIHWWRAGQIRGNATAAHESWLFAAAFSPDDKLLATGGGDNLIKLWDTNTKEQIGELAGHDDDVHAIAFTRDGRTLFSTGDDMTIRSTPVVDLLKSWRLNSVVGLSNGCDRLGKIVGHHADTIPSLAVDPQGRLIASGSRDKTIGLWNAEGGERMGTLTGHTDDVMSVAFFTDGETVASASYDETVRLWDVESRQTTHVLKGHKGRVYSVAVSHDGTMLASGGEDGVIIWGAGRTSAPPIPVSQKSCVLRPRFRLENIQNASCVRFTNDDRQLVVSAADGGVRYVDVPTGQVDRIVSTSRVELALD